MKTFIALAITLVTATSCYFEDDGNFDNRRRITGSYDMEEHSETFNQILHYRLWITTVGCDENEVYLENFYDADLRVRAIMRGDKLTIPYQVIDGYEIEGTATIFNNEIHFNYRVEDRYSYEPVNFCEARAFK